MDIKDINKIYMESLANQVADWHNSLGGKIVGGVGSLFKLSGKGIKAGAKKSASGIKNYFKERKTKQKIQQFITNSYAIYDPMTIDIITLSENKEELKYLMELADESLPSNLKRFLEIFKSCGIRIFQIIQQNKDLLKDSSKLNALIKQGLLQKIESFKESIEASNITTQNINFKDIYLNILLESATKQDIQNELLGLNFNKQNNELYAKFDGIQLKNWLSSNVNINHDLLDLIQQDTAEIKALADNDKLSIKIKSNISNEFIDLTTQIDNSTETKDKLIELIGSYYLTKAGISDTKTNLNKQLNNIKLNGYNNVLSSANYVILNDIKWTGWFGSLKKVLREAAACNINIEQIKKLALLYFHISFIK